MTHKKKQVLYKQSRKEDYPQHGGNNNHYELLCEILCLVKQLILQGEAMAKTIDDLKASVTANTNATRAALLLLQGIVDKLKACETVQDFEAVTAELDGNTKALADAVTANTPAGPTT